MLSINISEDCDDLSLLHLSYSREKVWQALGLMPLFEAGSCRSNNWLHAAAWEFSHRAWQAPARGPTSPKAVTGKSPFQTAEPGSFSARKCSYMAPQITPATKLP